MTHLIIYNDKLSLMDGNKELLFFLIKFLNIKNKDDLMKFTQIAAQKILEAKELCIVEKFTYEHGSFFLKKMQGFYTKLMEELSINQEILLNKIYVETIYYFTDNSVLANLTTKIISEKDCLEITANPNDIKKMDKRLLPNFNLTIKFVDYNIAKSIKKIIEQEYGIKLLRIEAPYCKQHDIEDILISKRSHHALKIEFSHQSSEDEVDIINVAKKLLISRGVSIKSNDSKKLYSLEQVLTENTLLEMLSDQGLVGILFFTKIYPSKKSYVQNFLNEYWKYYDGLIKDFFQASSEHQEAFIDFLQEGHFKNLCCSMRKLLAVFTQEHLNAMVTKSLNQYSYDSQSFNNCTKKLIKNELSPLLKILEQRLTDEIEGCFQTYVQTTIQQYFSKLLSGVSSTWEEAHGFNLFIDSLVCRQFLRKEFKGIFLEQWKLYNIYYNLQAKILDYKSRFINDNGYSKLSNFIAETIKSTIEEAIDLSFVNQKKRNKVNKNTGQDTFKALIVPKDIMIKTENDLFTALYINKKILGIRLFVDMFPHRKSYVVQILEQSEPKKDLIEGFFNTSKEHRDYFINLFEDGSYIKNFFINLDKILASNAFAISFLVEEIETFIKNNPSDTLESILPSILPKYSNYLNQKLDSIDISPILKDIPNLSAPDATKANEAIITLQQNIKCLFETSLVFAELYEKNIQDKICREIIHKKDQINTHDAKHNHEQLRQLIIEAVKSVALNIEEMWQNIEQQEEQAAEKQPQDDNYYYNEEIEEIGQIPQNF